MVQLTSSCIEYRSNLPTCYPLDKHPYFQGCHSTYVLKSVNPLPMRTDFKLIGPKPPASAREFWSTISDANTGKYRPCNIAGIKFRPYRLARHLPHRIRQTYGTPAVESMKRLLSMGMMNKHTPLNFEKVSKKIVTNACTFFAASSVVLIVSP
jgi:hypothetical protein